MISIARSKAEESLFAIQKPPKKPMSDLEVQTLKTRETISRLKSLRLAQESEGQTQPKAKTPVRRRPKRR